MKITKIEKENLNIYAVTLTPNRFERILGFTENVKRYKDSGSTFTFGGGNVYINQKGEKEGPWHDDCMAIDKWRRAF